MYVKAAVALVAGAAILGLARAPAAQADQTLRVADSLPVGHYAAEQGIKPWMEAVTQKTNGAVTFQYFPAEQLGKAKDLLALTQNGVVDGGYIQPAYISEKIPLSTVVELPGIYGNSCDATKSFWSLAEGGGLLDEKEYGPNGVKLLFAVVMAPYQVMTKQKIDSLDSFEGLKLRTGGTTQDAMVRALDAVPVRVAGPEMYEALSRGTADGVVLPLASVLSYDLQKLVKYATVDQSFGTTVVTYMISTRLFDSLPPDVQTVMVESGEEASLHACAYIDAQSDKNIARLRDAGVTVDPLPADLGKELRAALAPTAAEWAKSLDAKGKPGSEALQAYRAGSGS